MGRGSPRSFPPAGLRSGPLPWVLYAAALLVLACGVYYRLLGDLGDSVFAGNDDPSLFVWWFSHAAAVVSSWFDRAGGDHSLLYTTLMNAPDGVNGAWNTSVLGLAVPMIPVTLTLGPVVSYNLLIVASPAITAFAVARTLGRFSSLPAAWLGGLLYGFSSYVIAQSAGHLNLSFAILPPIVAGVIYDVFAGGRSRRPPAWRVGLRLGLALAFQLYLSTELLASTALMTLVLLIALAAANRRLFLAGLRRLLGVGAVGALISLLIGSPLLWTLVAGGGGPQVPVRPHGVFQNDLLDLFVPARTTLLSGVPRPGFPAPSIDAAEYGLYLGVPLVLLLLVVTIGAWRGADPAARTIARAAAVTGTVAWLLSLGSELTVAGEPSGLLLPWRLFELTPVLSNVLPMRLSVFVTLAAAVLLALGFDWMARRSRVVALTASVLALAFVLPAPIHPHALNVPAFFTDGRVVSQIPAGSLVKSVPRPRAFAHPGADETMVWQAVTGMHYRETGGYFIGSAPGVPLIYEAIADGYDEVVDQASQRGALPEQDSPEALLAASALRSEHVDYVIIGPGVMLTLDPAVLAEWTARTLGTRARYDSGVWIVPVR